MPNRFPTKKILNQLTEKFKVSGPAVELEDPQCMPRMPVGVLRHHREEPVREVPPSLGAHGPCSHCRQTQRLRYPCTEAGQ